MDQNTSQGAQQGGQFNPFIDPATQAGGQAGAGTGGTSQDDTTVTPPWLSFGQTQDTGTQTDPFATSFTDPFAPVDTTSTEGTNQSPVNPWETPSTPAANPWETQETPASTPWETPIPTPNEIPTENAPWNQPAVENAPIETSWMNSPMEPILSSNEPVSEENPMTDDTSMSKKSSEDLLAELKKRFEEEEKEVEEEIKIHEENIKMEQDAIRNLKAARREQVSQMKHMFEELKVILKIEKEEPKPQEKPKPIHPKPQHPQARPPQPQRDRPPQERPQTPRPQQNAA